MTLESAMQLARTLYGPYIATGFANEALIEAAAKIIKNHVELDQIRAKLAELEATA